MKKGLWVLLLLCVVVAILYAFIPGHVRLRQEIGVAVNATAFNRKFPDHRQWAAWWPGDTTANGDHRYNGRLYRIKQKGLTSLQIIIRNDADSIPSELLFIPLSEEKIRLQWDAVALTAVNPFQRVKRFLGAEDIQRDMARILEKASAYYSKPANLYSVDVQKATVKDSGLISITTTATNYPTVSDTYALVEKLQAFASAQGARQSGLPMLNVSGADSSGYRVQVAIPVDKFLADADDIRYKRMLSGGNILVTEVKGGPHTISKGFAGMAEYAADHQRYAPAINYQSLVTDRRTEPDTSKWVTKLYWPVM